MHKLNDVKVDETNLLKKGYNAKDLIDKTFVVTDVREVDNDGEGYLSCTIEGEGIEPGRPLNTGAQNISVKLWAAKEQGMLPLEVKVVKLGGNALDIV